MFVLFGRQLFQVIRSSQFVDSYLLKTYLVESASLIPNWNRQADMLVPISNPGLGLTVTQPRARGIHSFSSGIMQMPEWDYLELCQ